jgi:hypothetical protein
MPFAPDEGAGDRREAPTDAAARRMLEDLIERQFNEWLYARRELVADIPAESKARMREAFRAGFVRGLGMVRVRHSR